MQKAAAKKAAEGAVMSDDERRKLVSTETSLSMEPEPKIPTAIEGLETFSLSGSSSDDDEEEKPKKDGDYADADSFFNLPHGSHDDDEDDEDK